VGPRGDRDGERLRAGLAEGLRDEAEYPPCGIVGGDVEHVAGGAVEDMSHQRGAGAERVQVEQPKGRLVGVAREDHQVR
jgi:hypothetical protein